MGDFNCHSQHWWPAGDNNAEDTEIDKSTLGLTQLIYEPTSFEPRKNPPCIDLIFTDQHTIVMESGTRPSLPSPNYILSDQFKTYSIFCLWEKGMVLQ